jgi:predicted aldo/keto reductase-like oxidoreductase
VFASSTRRWPQAPSPNDLLIYGDNGRARVFYSWIEEEKRAQACIECGECLRSPKGRLRTTGALPVEKCPQGIEIPEWLKTVHAVLCQEEAEA